MKQLVCKVNGNVQHTSKFEALTVEEMHYIKSEFGSMFYHDETVLSVEVNFDGIVFLRLLKDPVDGHVTQRLNVDSQSLLDK